MQLFVPNKEECGWERQQTEEAGTQTDHYCNCQEGAGGIWRDDCHLRARL